MMGRAGRPQYDDSAVAVIYVQDSKKVSNWSLIFDPNLDNSRISTSASSTSPSLWNRGKYFKDVIFFYLRRFYVSKENTWITWIIAKLHDLGDVYFSIILSWSFDKNKYARSLLDHFSLLPQLANHVNAEINAGTITSRQQVSDSQNEKSKEGRGMGPWDHYFYDNHMIVEWL